MPVEEVFFTLLIVGLLSLIVVAANYADRDRNRHLRTGVVASLVLINVVIVVVYGLIQVILAYSPAPTAGDLARPEKSDAVWGAITSIIVSGLATAALSRSFRRRLAALFFVRFHEETNNRESVGTQDSAFELEPHPDQEPLFPQMLNYYTTDNASSEPPVSADPAPRFRLPEQRKRSGALSRRGFDPESVVHMVALVFCIYLLGVQFIGFILGGGLAGVAEDLAEGLSGWDLVLNAIPLLAIPVLGVGLGIRRGGRQTLARLGLGLPSGEGIAAAFAVTIGLLIFVAAVVTAWSGMVSEETFQEQTEASDALSRNITTLGMAFLLAATAAVSEEIAFRGALQPVLGFWATAVVFALTHLQYTLTPASLIILGVALAFGWIRHRYNTTVAILTHFFYNFIPLALSVSNPSEAVEWLLRLF